MSAKKSKTKRNTKKYPALDRTVNLKSRQELIDYDYLDQLDEKSLQWLNKFTEEYVNASFDKNPRKNLHRTKALRKDCYDRNNARNRDIMTKAKTLNKLTAFEDVDMENKEQVTEDTVIRNLDKKKLSN